MIDRVWELTRQDHGYLQTTDWAKIAQTGLIVNLGFFTYKKYCNVL